MLSANYQKHFPVMLLEVLQALQPTDGKIYVDATFGNGGYSEAILNSADCQVIALDRDPSVQPRAEEMRRQYGARFDFRAGQFSDFATLVNEEIDGAVFDIGVSSMQLDQAERGFSFAKDAPLDMRMSQNGISAADIVNSYDEEDLANLIYQFGEERKSRAIARKIIEVRKIQPISTTKQLANIIYGIIHKTPKAIDPATRTFQALRIAVNDELGELQQGLKGATSRLKTGGRLVVVDFHSLEDRIVKNYFKENTGKAVHVSRYRPETSTIDNGKVFSECSKAIMPSPEELTVNNRSRSAKLRYAVKK